MLSERARDWLVTVIFLGSVGSLVAVGWAKRERAPRLATGDLAPAITLPRIDGGTASLADYRGEVVLLNLWATWCAPCVKEMPSMQRVYERYRDQGFQILAVAVDDRPGERHADGRIVGKVSEFAARFGLTFPIVVDPSGDTERALGVEYLPTTLLIDRTGRIRGHEVGGRAWHEEPYLGMIRRLLEE